MGAWVGAGGCVEVATGVLVGVGDWTGTTSFTTTTSATSTEGVAVGVGSGAFRAALAGAVGAGIGVSVGAGAGRICRVVPACGDGQHDDRCQCKGDRPHVRVSPSDNERLPY